MYQCQQLSPSACTLRDSSHSISPQGEMLAWGLERQEAAFHSSISLFTERSCPLLLFSSPSLVVTAHVMVSFCSPKFLQEDEVGRSRWDFTFLRPLQTMAKDTVVCHPPSSVDAAWSLGVNFSSTSTLDAYPSKKQTQNKKSRCSTSEASSVGQKKHNPQGPS